MRVAESYQQARSEIGTLVDHSHRKLDAYACMWVDSAWGVFGYDPSTVRLQVIVIE